MCPLQNKKKEGRKDVVESAKTSAAELQLALEPTTSMEMKVDQLLNLPKSADEILIPAEAQAKVEALLAKEKEMLAVDKTNLEVAAANLKEIGVVADKWDEIEMLTKKPYAEAKKAVEAAFGANAKLLAAAKISWKAKINKFYADEEKKKADAEAAQKAEQDRIAKELADKEAEAAKLKGKAKAKAEADAQELRNKAVEASVVSPVAEPPKVAGLAAKKVWTFDIPDVAKIPERYLIKYEGPLTLTGEKPVVIVQVDGKVLTGDAVAGRLKNHTWLKATSATSTNAR